jgi:hypothetical protein
MLRRLLGTRLVGAVGLLAAQRQSVFCAPGDDVKTGKYLELRPGVSDAEGQLGPSSPAVAAAKLGAQKLGAQICATARLEHWTAVLQTTDTLDPYRFFSVLRLPTRKPNEKTSADFRVMDDSCADLIRRFEEKRGSNVRYPSGFSERDRRQREDEFEELVSAYQLAYEGAQTQYRKTLDKHDRDQAKELDRRGEQSDDDDMSGRPRERNERQKDRRQRLADRLHSNHASMERLNVADPKALYLYECLEDIYRGSVAQNPYIPSFENTKFGFFGEQPFKRPSGVLEAVRGLGRTPGVAWSRANSVCAPSCADVPVPAQDAQLGRGLVLEGQRGRVPQTEFREFDGLGSLSHRRDGAGRDVHREHAVCASHVERQPGAARSHVRFECERDPLRPRQAVGAARFDGT